MFRTVFAHIDQGACLTDLEGRVVEWNPAAERLTGYAVEPGGTVDHIYSPDLRAQARASGQEVSGPISLRCHDGRQVDVVLTAVPHPEGTVELFRQLAPPLSVVAHELRSPLSALLGFASLLEHPRHQDRQAELRRSVRRSAELLAALLANVALAGSLEADLQVVFQPVELGPLFEEVAELFAPQATGRELTFEVSGGEGLSVHAERSLLRQILVNLLTNALRNTEKGTVQLAAARDEEQVVVTVSDTGRGMSASELASVVRKFSSLPGHRPGIGLGLYVTRGLLERHCSALRLESSPGEGTRASFSLELV